MTDTGPAPAPPQAANGPRPGACIWLTGPSGAGETTVTRALLPLLESAGRTVTVLDTVPLLARLPGERGSSKLLRKAFVASEVVRHGGIVICVTVSATRAVRAEAREIVGADHFLEVHFDLPIDVADTGACSVVAADRSASS